MVTLLRFWVVYTVGLLFIGAGSASAQAPPAWVGVSSVGATVTSPALAVDGAGNSYLAGRFSGTTVIGGTTLISQGYDDGFLAKFTPTGALAWVYRIGSAGADGASGVALDAAGNVYVVGSFGGAITLSPTLVLTGSSGFYVARFSPLGVPEWARQSNTPGAGATSLGTDAAGHVYVAGYFTSTFTLGSTTLTVPATYAAAGTFLLRLSTATGALEALQPVHYYLNNGTSTAQYYSPLLAVAPTGETYVLLIFTERPVVGSTTFISQGLSDILVVKYTAQGALDWQRQFGGPFTDFLADGVVDSAGNLYLSGSFIGTATFGTTAATSTGGHDGYLLKYSPAGTVQWVQSGGSSAYDVWTGVGLDRADNPYVVGSFNGVAHFGALTLTSAGGSDVAVAAYSAQGQLRWLQQAGGPAGDDAYGLGLSASGDIYVSGTLRGPCAFGSFTLTGSATIPPVENFLARLGNSVLATAPARPLRLGSYPSPATDRVQLPGVPADSRVEVLDAVGRIVRQVRCADLSVRGLAPGHYTLRATDAQGRWQVGRIAVAP